MSAPEQQPKFFLDRSLGRVAIPALLRADGWELVTLAGHYGVPEAERIADTEHHHHRQCRKTRSRSADRLDEIPG